RDFHVTGVQTCALPILMTIATVTISFLPHQVAMASFLPLERVRPVAWIRRGRGAATDAPTGGDTAPATADGDAPAAGDAATRPRSGERRVGKRGRGRWR